MQDASQTFKPISIGVGVHGGWPVPLDASEAVSAPIEAIFVLLLAVTIIVDHSLGWLDLGGLGCSLILYESYFKPDQFQRPQPVV